MAMFATIKWKNIRTWKTEFSGDISFYIEDRGIRVEIISSETSPDIKGLRFTITVSSAKCVFDHFGDDNRGYLKAAQIYLTMLGDQAKIISAYGTHEIN